jgi:carboxypeptidase D
MSLIETFPQLIGYDPVVYEYFKEQLVVTTSLLKAQLITICYRAHLCEYDLNLTYPQQGDKFPTLKELLPSRLGAVNGQLSPQILLKANSMHKALIDELVKPRKEDITPRDLQLRQDSQAKWKRDLSLRANGTIDPWYGCLLTFQLAEYAFNYTYPWSKYFKT